MTLIFQKHLAQNNDFEESIDGLYNAMESMA